MKRLSAIILSTLLTLAFSISPARATVTTTPIGTGGGGGSGTGIQTNGGTGINNSLSNLTVKSSSTITPAITFAGGTLGLGTNENLGEVWAPDFGFSPTNSAMGNSNALEAAILICSNNGGGIIRYGTYPTNNGLAQVINLVGQHKFPQLAYPARIKLQGDGSTAISWSGVTTNAALFGCFDAKDVVLNGPETTNSVGTYPYTNCVGMYVGFLYDPVLENCQVTGFGQGIALEQTGSFRGARLVGCQVNNCGIGYAIGDACDQTTMVQCAYRANNVGLDICCRTSEFITNTPGFIYMANLTGGTNVSGSRAIVVRGGISDYNVIPIIIGKGQGIDIEDYQGTTHLYQLCLGHPTNWINPGWTYNNESGGNPVALNNCQWYENAVVTNIYVDPRVAQQPALWIHGSSIGAGSGYGVLNSLAYFSCDPGSFNVGTNYSPYATIAPSFAVTDNKHEYVVPSQTGSAMYDENGGTFANTFAHRNRYHGSFSSETAILDQWQTVNFSLQQNSAFTLQSMGNASYFAVGQNFGFMTDGTNAGTYGVFTNSISAPTNTASIIRVSSSGLHSLVLNRGWTNDLGARAYMVLDFSAPSSCTNWLAITNTTSGECHSNWMINNDAFGRVAPYTVQSPLIGPNEKGTISNYFNSVAGAVGASLVNAEWVLSN